MSEKQTTDTGTPFEIFNEEEAAEKLHEANLQPLVQHWMNAYYGVMNSKNTQETLHKDMQWIMNDLRDTKQISVATNADQVIGMVGYKKTANQMPPPKEGVQPRDVYALFRASTLPAFEGKGVYSQLKAKVLQELKEKYPDALVLSTTKNPTVKRRNKELGYVPLDPKTYLHLQGCSEEDIEQYLEILRQEGWDIKNTEKGWLSLPMNVIKRFANYWTKSDKENEKWEAFILDLQSKEAIG